MKVLLTGAGAPGWYGAYSMIKMHGNHRIVSCDIRDGTVGQELSDHFFIALKGSDPDYCNDLISKKLDLDVILPITDPELIPLAENRERLKAFLPISSAESLKILLDKEKLYSTVPELSPAMQEFSNLEDAAAFIKSTGNPDCFIKLKSGYGSRGTKRLVADSVWLEGFSQQKPEEFGLTFPIGQVDKLNPDVPKILVASLPGEEYSIDCVFNEQSQLVFYAVRQRAKIRNGICDTAILTLDRDQEFFLFITALNKKIPMRYNINIQVKRDQCGVLKLLEVNPRISGSLSAFKVAGHSLLGLTLDLLGNPDFKGLITPEKYSITSAIRYTDFIGIT